MRSKAIFSAVIFFILFLSEAPALENIWFSATPPDKISKKIHYGMRGQAYIKDEDGREKKILWIKSGNFPVESPYTDHTSRKKPVFFILSPDKKLIKGELSHGLPGYFLTFEGNLEGFYNLYLIEKFVKKEILNIITAKAEVISHKCSRGHGGMKKKMETKILKQAICFEILRKRIPGEDFHTFLSSGDKATFKVFFNGTPLKDSKITFKTQKGWSKSLWTDINGEAVFQIIGDYYPDWKKLNRKKIHTFLITAEHTVKKTGIYKEIVYKQIHYTGTLKGCYIPSKALYSSSLHGFFLLIFIIITTAGFIYFHRTRRKKLFKEYTFNEKD